MLGILAGGQQVPFRKYRTSLLVKSNDGHRILIDCGPDFSHQLREFNFGIADAILITHPHPDHIGGLDELNLYRPTGRLPIPAYATAACWDNIKHQRGLGYIIGIGLVSENVLTLQPATRSITVGAVTITAFPVEHHPVAPGAVGYVLEETMDGKTKRVLYTGDFWTVSNPADPLFAQESDVAIIECDRWSRLAGPAVGGGHMSFQEAVRMLNDGVFSNPRPNQVVFVHFGDNGPVGPGSTYQDWRDAAINGLAAKPWGAAVMPNPDAVIGYEGLTLTL
jgi:phosphoribosyl 1,2-cyclic phosphodiesterase